VVKQVVLGVEDLVADLAEERALVQPLLPLLRRYHLEDLVLALGHETRAILLRRQAVLGQVVGHCTAVPENSLEAGFLSGALKQADVEALLEDRAHVLVQIGAERFRVRLNQVSLELLLPQDDLAADLAAVEALVDPGTVELLC